MGRNEHPDRMKCIDLWRTYGDRYRVTIDPAYQAERIRRDRLDPWYFVIPCKFGTIWPCGWDCLAMDIDCHGRTAAKVRAIPGVRVWLDGEHEQTLIFPERLFEEVAKIVLPRTRHKLTKEQKEVLVARLKPYQFPKR